MADTASVRVVLLMIARCIRNTTNAALLTDWFVIRFWPLTLEAPQITFRIATGEFPIAIVGLPQFHLDPCARFFHAGKERVWIIYGDVERICAPRLNFSDQHIIVVVTALAKHQDRRTIRELGMLYDPLSPMNEVLTEAKDSPQPFNHRLGIPTTHCRKYSSRLRI